MSRFGVSHGFRHAGELSLLFWVGFWRFHVFFKLVGKLCCSVYSAASPPPARLNGHLSKEALSVVCPIGRAERQEVNPAPPNLGVACVLGCAVSVAGLGGVCHAFGVNVAVGSRRIFVR